MKLLLTAFLSFIIISVCAQVPQGISYQAIARGSQGNVIPSQSINVRFTILDGGVNGTAVYQETHATQTSNFGLFSLVIGGGTVLSGNFAAINWPTGNKFLKVEVSKSGSNGNNSYELQGTTQLLTVPYAFYAQNTKLTAGTGISITNGNTINANYQAGTGINITGNTISGNYVAGNGINISGNTISATNSLGYWVADANGIQSTVQKVGIGANSDAYYPLRVRQPNYGDGRSVALFESDDNWHSSIIIKSNTTNQEYSLVVGGVSNYETRPKNFAIWNKTMLRPSFAIDGFTNKIGIGMNGTFVPEIKSTLHVFTGDVNIEEVGSGIILKSPNGACWRVTIDNAGNLVRTAIQCP